MKRYAMVPINAKEDEKRNPIVRRALIEFQDIECGDMSAIFKGTRFLDSDPYFSSPTSSHKYEFEDSGYRLISNINTNAASYSKKLYDLRPYHWNFSDDPICPPAIIFLAQDDENAKYRFHQRREKRD